MHLARLRRKEGLLKTHEEEAARDQVRAAAGLGDMTLYLATRHYVGYYALNVLDLEPA